MKLPTFGGWVRSPYSWERSGIFEKDQGTFVELSGNGLTDSDLPALFQQVDEILLHRSASKGALGSDVQALNMDLSCNPSISDDGVVQHLAPFLRRWPACRRLKLYKTCIGDRALDALSGWVAAGYAQELHLSDLGARVTGGAVYRLLEHLYSKGHYPYRGGHGAPCPLWLRLEHNGIRDTERLVDRFWHRGMALEVVNRADLGRIRPGVSSAWWGSRGVAQTAAVHLVLFHSQELRSYPWTRTRQFNGYPAASMIGKPGRKACTAVVAAWTSTRGSSGRAVAGTGEAVRRPLVRRAFLTAEAEAATFAAVKRRSPPPPPLTPPPPPPLPPPLLPPPALEPPLIPNDAGDTELASGAAPAAAATTPPSLGALEDARSRAPLVGILEKLMGVGALAAGGAAAGFADSGGLPVGADGRLDGSGAASVAAELLALHLRKALQVIVTCPTGDDPQVSARWRRHLHAASDPEAEASRILRLSNALCGQGWYGRLASRQQDHSEGGELLAPPECVDGPARISGPSTTGEDAQLLGLLDHLRDPVVTEELIDAGADSAQCGRGRGDRFTAAPFVDDDSTFVPASPPLPKFAATRPPVRDLEHNRADGPSLHSLAAASPASLPPSAPMVPNMATVSLAQTRLLEQSIPDGDGGHLRDEATANNGVRRGAASSAENAIAVDAAAAASAEHGSHGLSAGEHLAAAAGFSPSESPTSSVPPVSRRKKGTNKIAQGSCQGGA